MKKRIISVAAVLLAVAIVFGVVRVSAIYSSDKIMKFEKAEKTPLITQSLTVSDDFGQICENVDYSLCLEGKTGNFYVKDKSTGVCWYANPANASEDEYATGVYKMELCSSLILTVYDIENSAVVKKNSEASCVRKGKFSLTGIKNGFRISYEFSDEGIIVPVNVILCDDYLDVSVDTDEIEENEKEYFRIQSIRLFPNFGAAGASDEGYAVIPDGCGAVMNFNNGKYMMDDYYGPVYGEDLTSTRLIEANPSEKVHLPVFGMMKNGSAFLSVITEGATSAAICAYPNLKYSSYSQCFAEYTLHSSYNYILDPSSTTAQSIKLRQTDKMEVDSCEQRYYFLKGDNCGYNEMAEKYRDYLGEAYDLSETSTESDKVLIDFVGAVKKQESIAGFPVTVTKSVSTLKEISDYYSRLSDEVGEGISVRLFSWNKADIDGKPEESASIYSKIGKWKEAEQLNGIIAENNGIFALGVNLLSFSENSFSYVSSHDSAKNLSGSPAYQYKFSYGTRMQDDSYDSWYLLNPNRLSGLTNKFLSAIEKKADTGLSPFRIGNNTYGNYDKDIITEANAKTAFEDALQQMQKSHDLILEASDAYAIRYGSLIAGAPTSSSGYDVLDGEIPFYQLSVSGFCPFTTESLNLATEPDDMFLKAVATGSQLHYELITGKTEVLLGSDHDYLYSADSQEYYDKICESVNKLHKVAQKTENSRLVRVMQLGQGVTLSEFANGCRVAVNMNDTAVETAHGRVEAKSYLIVGESE